MWEEMVGDAPVLSTVKGWVASAIRLSRFSLKPAPSTATSHFKRFKSMLLPRAHLSTHDGNRVAATSSQLFVWNPRRPP